MALLSIENLSISFGGIKALTDVGLEVQPEEILTVIGPNGSGKTTLFNCISGVYKADHGRIQYNGESLNGLSRITSPGKESPAPFKTSGFSST